MFEKNIMKKAQNNIDSPINYGIDNFPFLEILASLLGCHGELRLGVRREDLSHRLCGSSWLNLWRAHGGPHPQ